MDRNPRKVLACLKGIWNSTHGNQSMRSCIQIGGRFALASKSGPNAMDDGYHAQIPSCLAQIFSIFAILLLSRPFFNLLLVGKKDLTKVKNIYFGPFHSFPAFWRKVSILILQIASVGTLLSPQHNLLDRGGSGRIQASVPTLSYSCFLCPVQFYALFQNTNTPPWLFLFVFWKLAISASHL